MLYTPLCDRLGLRVPIVQAPVGSASCPALAAAVSEAGGLGMLAVTWRSLRETRRVVRETKRLTSRPFGVNLVLDAPLWEDRQETNPQRHLEACLDEGAPIVSFFWEVPGDLIAQTHDAGATVLQTVSSAVEAREAVRAGADVLVPQGVEAGGHVRGGVSTMSLIPRVTDAAAEASPGEGVPVVAAGGVADGRGVAAALALGAAGAMLGTRFVASDEADVSDAYKRRITEAEETDTSHGTPFDGGWPGAPHRVLRNRTVQSWEEAGRPLKGERPGEGDRVATGPDGTPVYRYDDVIPTAGIDGDADDLALYAGQSCGLVESVRPAGEIVDELASESDKALQRALESVGR